MKTVQLKNRQQYVVHYTCIILRKTSFHWRTRLSCNICWFALHETLILMLFQSLHRNGRLNTVKHFKIISHELFPCFILPPHIRHIFISGILYPINCFPDHDNGVLVFWIVKFYIMSLILVRFFLSRYFLRKYTGKHKLTLMINIEY